MQPIILKKGEIIELLDFNEIINVIEESFVDFTDGKTLMPPPKIFY